MEKELVKRNEQNEAMREALEEAQYAEIDRAADACTVSAIQVG